MKRIVSLLAGIVVLLALGGVATAGSNASVEKVVYSTERYQLVPVEQGNVDADPPGTSLGDQTVSRNDLLRHGQKEGSLSASCTFTGIEPKPVLIRTGVAQFHNGQVALQGRIPSRFLSGPQGSFKFAIIGGTGSYRNARGSVLVEAGASSITFNLIT